jgi:serine protease Do
MVAAMKRVIRLAVASAVLTLAAAAIAQSPTGYLGLVAKPVPRALARAAGIQQGDGAMVVEVVPGGPAAVAGVREGDVVVALDGQKVIDPEWLATTITARRPGSHVVIEVVRQRLHVTLRVLLGAPRPGPSRSDLPKAAGASVRSK